jgi:ribosomal-protein-alanine N-acetyltransferase
MVPPTFDRMVRMFHRRARQGQLLGYGVEFEGELVGQLTVSALTWGSMCSGHIGYWVDQKAAGRGIIPTAVALTVDHCFGRLGLHRLEVNIRPENRASIRVVEKLGFRPEGLRRNYLHIDGSWRDHLSFALTTEDIPGGLLARWRPIAADQEHYRAERVAANLAANLTPAALGADASRSNRIDPTPSVR